MAFHKIAYAVWKHPANACDCGAAPPAPTAPAQGEVDHARATRLSDTMLRDDGYVPSLNERQNLARSHAALLREVEAHKKRYKDACKTCGDLEDQLEAAEAKVAALRFELAEYVRADACHQESIAGSEQRAEAAERREGELREAASLALTMLDNNNDNSRTHAGMNVDGVIEDMRANQLTAADTRTLQRVSKQCYDAIGILNKVLGATP